MNTPIGFSIAKLLKEKGFKEVCVNAYADLRPLEETFNEEITEYAHIQDHNAFDYRYSAPTIAETIMWIYDKYGIWIYLVPAEDNKSVFKPFFRGKDIIDQHSTSFYNTPTEAYEEAIKYILKQLK